MNLGNHTLQGMVSPNEPAAGAVLAVDGAVEGGEQENFVGIGVDEAGAWAVRLFAERVGELAGRGRTIIDW